MKHIQEVTREVLNGLFELNVEPFFRRRIDRDELNKFSQNNKQSDEVDNLLRQEFSVLGIDIFRYSSFPVEKQIFVPVVFRQVYDYAVRILRDNFKWLFQSHEKYLFDNRFISTGDGGYLILDTPLHSIVFGIVMELAFRMYNSFHLFAKLRNAVGAVTPRYSMAFGNVYKYDHNFFGAGIINCARLLHADRLNRLLIDGSTYDWFMIEIAGLENLRVLCLNELVNQPDFTDYDTKYFDEDNALFPAHDVHSYELKRDGIKSVDVEKIGIIGIKNTEIDVYNLHIQSVIEFTKITQEPMLFSVSLGNLNTSGIGY